MSRVFAAVNATTDADRVRAAALILCAAAIASAALRLLLLRCTQRFAAQAGHQLLVETYRRVLAQPYQWHVEHNSAEIVSAVTKVEILAHSVLLQAIQAVTASLVIVALGIFLAQVAPAPLAVAALAVGLAYLMVGAYARSRLGSQSRQIGGAFDDRIRTIQESSEGIRDLRLYGIEARAVQQLQSIDYRLATARAKSMFLTSAPRIPIEAAGIIAVAIVTSAIASRPDGIIIALPVLAAFALAAQRLLPMIQQLYSSWSTFTANRQLIAHVARLSRLPITVAKHARQPLPFQRNIEFTGVSFRYSGRDCVAVHDLTFRINKGARVALVGPSGSGKSTTADLLMGLLTPSEGKIYVDGRVLSEENRVAWQSNIAHVPQRLFVADATIAQNIAFSEHIDEERLRIAAQAAQLEQFIRTLPDGLETRVGERGARLSGGERQRLAIARAIYKDAPLFVLDEATSALDSDTEKAVILALDRLQDEGKTIVIIAHRGVALQSCDTIIRLARGKLTSVARA